MGPVITDLGQCLIRVLNHRGALVRAHRRDFLTHVRNLPGIGHNHLMGLVRTQIGELL